MLSVLFPSPASVSTAKLGPSASFKHFSVCRQLSAPSSPHSAPYPHCLSVLMSSCCPNSAHSFAATLVSPRAQSNLRPFQLAATSACIALPHISSWLPRLLLVFTRSSHLICEVHPDPPLQFNSANSSDMKFLVAHVCLLHGDLAIARITAPL